MRNYYIFRLVVFTAFSVLIGVFAHDIIAYLHYLVGGVMLLYGFEGILFTVARVKTGFYKDYQFFLGEQISYICSMNGIKKEELDIKTQTIGSYIIIKIGKKQPVKATNNQGEKMWALINLI